MDTRNLQLLGQRLLLCIGGRLFRRMFTSFAVCTTKLSVEMLVEQLSKTWLVFFVRSVICLPIFALYVTKYLTCAD